MLHTDIRAAAADDDLDTAHYGELADRSANITGDPLNLIETLAERIADGVLRTSPSAVEVTVHKPQAPIEVPFGDVTVSIYRERT